MVQMGVSGADNQIVVIVLQVHQLLRQKSQMVIIDQGHGAYDWSTWIMDCCHHQTVANQVTERFGPVRVALVCDESIETPQQLRVNCHADAIQDTHNICADGQRNTKFLPRSTRSAWSASTAQSVKTGVVIDSPAIIAACGCCADCVGADRQLSAWERTVIFLCLLDLAWFAIAFCVHPSAGDVLRHTMLPSMPGSGLTAGWLFLVIAIVGTTIAPWQLFFQQSCVADKRPPTHSYRL